LTDIADLNCFSLNNSSVRVYPYKYKWQKLASVKATLGGGAENAGVENAGVEEAGVDRTGGICRSG